MYSRLAIDTTSGAVAGPSSVTSRYRRTPSPAGPKLPGRRVRSVSNASSTSSLSIVSPLSSSTNGSQISLVLPDPGNDTIHPRSRSASPAIDDTIRAGTEYVLAMHDYAPEHGHDTCLSFRAGQVIHVLNRDTSGWWDGELEGGRRGWFPSNYVSQDVMSLRDEAPLIPSTSRHNHSDSSSSATSWVTSMHSTHSRTASQSTTRSTRTDESEGEPPCPPIMDSLLKALTLLQTAVRGRKPSHFQPSTVCIVKGVRVILSATDTLQKTSPILQIYPQLLDERRQVLDGLTELVVQAKKASNETLPDINQVEEMEAMARVAGQVFARVRRFLAVAEDCGVELPEELPEEEVLPSARSMQSDDEGVSTPIDTGRTPTQHRTLGSRHSNPAPPLTRTKSQSELRGRVRSPLGQVHNGSLSANPFGNGRQLQQQQQNSIGRAKGHRHNPSTSSVSSTSSFSSQGSGTSISPVPFPNGPSSAAQVLEALKYTHDQYLSTIAAFIGHAHSHSRTSHASSTGQLYDLVREIVELVCKLLTIVESVMQHPDVPGHRLGSLKAAKEGLFNVTSSLAESVRLLTMSLPSTLSEEEEKKTLLQSATGALKAGGDCAAAVKVCLTRSLGDRPFIVSLPKTADLNEPFAPNKLTAPNLAKLVQGPGAPTNGYHLSGMDEEDLTIQPATPYPAHRHREASSERSVSDTSNFSRSRQHVHLPTVSLPSVSRPQHQHPSNPNILHQTSFAVRSDDGTTWEGSIRDHGSSYAPQSLASRRSEDLPPLPNEPFPEYPADPMTWLLSHDYASDDVAYNNEGHLVGATMKALAVKMTPHDSLVDPAFQAVFFLTFRLFSSPADLVDAIIARYNLTPPQGISREDELLWQQQKGIPVRLRVSNFIKTWLDTYWRSGPDDVALPLLTSFTREVGILAWLSNPPSIFSPTSTGEIPRPTMTKTLLSALRKKDFPSISITDFDALELARQLTIMECELYCAIQPNEILESGTEGAAPPVNVRAVSSLSTVITGWVAESILDELDLKKRTLLVKFFVKLADVTRPRSILAALDSSTISRLRQTWAGLPQKYKAQLETLRKLADHSRNYHEYRSKLRNTSPPAVPFLGLYLTDVTFCREGNPSHRPSPRNPAKKLINFNKYHKLARIIQDMQRFQVPYNLKAIPEVQQYLNVAFERARHHGDLQDLYRRSLLVEPKQAADTVTASNMRHWFSLATQSAQTAAS
ncbi:cell division control protein 25 [Coprinellus micaceus]|uniref:Cell division control protein 25 n=1 Tax=Coprinellus micaceus TaxID=71717 RepID=A0A4Y7SAD3_COPMI|nr:cell division control protein 25 [Coprinellus micaceus]